MDDEQIKRGEELEALLDESLKGPNFNAWVSIDKDAVKGALERYRVANGRPTPEPEYERPRLR